mmetsp:Transcript_19989/g.30874  ORF Transcript_19989/g.30874 Transcript_19989/m.30874 type:complete len:368 (+) Transcript_19989:340-1443(+)
MNEGFDFALQPYAGTYARFDSVVLDYQETRRHLRGQTTLGMILPLGEQDEHIYDMLWHVSEDHYSSTFHDNNRKLAKTRDIFTASYKGVSVWFDGGDKAVPDDELVYALELQILASREPQLLQALQAKENARGLGANVESVKVALSTVEESPSNNSDLNIIIIIAIVIAGMAFLLLATALYMAWSKKKEREAAYAVGTDRTTGMNSPKAESAKPNQPEKKKSLGKLFGSKKQEQATPVSYEETPKRKNYEDSDIAPSEIGGGLYADSLISEDISTSLTAYYRSGFDNSTSNKKESSKDRNAPKRSTSGGTNDNASISSMESYGYSLDGYQSSIAPSTSGYQNELYHSKGNNDSSVEAASDKDSAFSM